MYLAKELTLRDDLVIIEVDIGEISRFKSELSAAFEMKNLGDLHHFLGIEVIRIPDNILINHDITF